jgi:hypothetical protein
MINYKKYIKYKYKYKKLLEKTGGSIPDLQFLESQKKILSQDEIQKKDEYEIKYNDINAEIDNKTTELARIKNNIQLLQIRKHNIKKIIDKYNNCLCTINPLSWPNCFYCYELKQPCKKSSSQSLLSGNDKSGNDKSGNDNSGNDNSGFLGSYFDNPNKPLTEYDIQDKIKNQEELDKINNDIKILQEQFKLKNNEILILTKNKKQVKHELNILNNCICSINPLSWPNCFVCNLSLKTKCKNRIKN